MTDPFASRVFRVYVVPGAVFQSVMIGGGYGTGREIVEYFSNYGSVGGVMAVAIAFVAVAIVLAATFEFSRVTRTYDYRNFFRSLLGRYWVAFEILIILQFLLVLAVLASAAGNILYDNFALPEEVGIALMLAVVAILTFYGRELIAKVLTFWSLFLYVVLGIFVIAVFASDQIDVKGGIAQPAIASGWLISGLKYALYNLAAAPLLLYVARGFKTRREATRSGVIAAAMAMIPACLFHCVFVISPSAVLHQPIPVYWVMVNLGATGLLIIYSIMLFGTFIETGAGMLQGINERIDAYLSERSRAVLSRGAHAGIAVVAITLSAVLSHWGITRLIADGYGTMAWGFLIVYVVPLMTIGLRRIGREAGG